MNWLTKATSLGLVALLAGCSASNEEPVVLDKTAISAGKELARDGRTGVSACGSCHGSKGEGNAELGFPRLAGLHPQYIEKQLHDFRRDPLKAGVTVDPIARDYSKTPRIYKDLTIFTPGTRHDPVMNQIAVELSDKEITDLAHYYASLPFEAKPVPADFQTLERGMELAVRGKPEYMMPRCDACHGPNGEGFGEHFPPLAGQPEKYIISQLSKWQNGERDNDQMSMMKNTANLLTDADKVVVAKYYANQSFKVHNK